MNQIVSKYVSTEREHDIYRHSVELRMKFEDRDDISTIQNVVNGYKQMNTANDKAQAWLDANVKDWQYHGFGSARQVYYFAKHSDAMLFRLSEPYA